jgi:hypothetical protein
LVTAVCRATIIATTRAMISIAPIQAVSKPDAARPDRVRSSVAATPTAQKRRSWPGPDNRCVTAAVVGRNKPEFAIRLRHRHTPLHI